jgi:hypothetical protein
MPTPTYRPLATVTLGTTSTSVTFSNIPATYRDLIIVMNVVHSTQVERDIRIRFNADSGANYSRVAMAGNGSTATSFAFSGETAADILATSTTLSVSTFQIMDYSATDKHKTFLARANLTAGRVSAFASRWANTAAINSIEMFTDTGTLNAGGTFNLYGVIA